MMFSSSPSPSCSIHFIRKILVIVVFTLVFLTYAADAANNAMISSPPPNNAVPQISSTLKLTPVNRILISGNNTELSSLIRTHYSNLFQILRNDQVVFHADQFPYLKLISDITTKNERIDTGTSFLNQAIDYNDRLNYYDLYIKLALKKGYIVTTYYDYLTKYKDTKQKVLILRHDIDIASPGTLKMLEIEVRNHVKATYYFRWVTFDKSIIDKVVKAGGEVGLHYETLATYCIQNHLSSVGKQDIINCQPILKQEITDFKTRSGVDIKTIASHGNPVNRRIGIPNYVILDGQNYSDYGVMGETYDKNIITNYIKSYICDSELTINNGFSYRTNPIDSIDQNKQVIEFLSHPNHWYFDLLKRARLYIEQKNGLLKP